LEKGQEKPLERFTAFQGGKSGIDQFSQKANKSLASFQII
jgi:hypothetical protein